MQITTDPAALAGSLCLGLPEPVAVQALEGDWPSDVRLVLGSLAAPLATIPLAVAGAVASATIPAATVTAAHAALDGRPVPVVLLVGAGGSLDQVGGGRLWWRQESWGSDKAQSLGAVVVGPAGPTGVSADAGNAAGLGSDGLIFVSPTAGSAHAVRDEGMGVAARPALDFRGAGVTVTDDPGTGATRVTIPGGGASSLDPALIAILAEDAAKPGLFHAGIGTNYALSPHPTDGSLYDMTPLTEILGVI